MALENRYLIDVIAKLPGAQAKAGCLLLSERSRPITTAGPSGKSGVLDRRKSNTSQMTAQFHNYPYVIHLCSRKVKLSCFCKVGMSLSPGFDDLGDCGWD
ncbi:hypothetical protein M1D34_27625 (plasmid) [Ensifer sp. D2-11]